MSLNEDLSRLLAGDLPAAQAEALRQRIAMDPEVAHAWTALHTVVDDLPHLPEEAPPVALDALVLGFATAPRRPFSASTALGGALAAAALIWFAFRPFGATELPKPQVDPGDLLVDVDGIARISMNPPKESPMNASQSALAGALGGVAVTVAVLQGSAWVWSEDGSRVEVTAGQTHTTATDAQEPKLRFVVPAAPPGETPEEAVVRLEATVAALTSARDQAQFTGAVAQGQLVAHVGTPQEWPADLPPGYAADDMRARVDAVLEAHPDIELEEMDCSEYPCITIFRPLDSSEGWEERMKPAAMAMAEGLEDPGLSVAMSMVDNGGESIALLGVTVSPPEDTQGSTEVGARTKFRTSSLMEALGEEALEEDAPPVE